MSSFLAAIVVSMALNIVTNEENILITAVAAVIGSTMASCGCGVCRCRCVCMTVNTYGARKCSG